MKKTLLLATIFAILAAGCSKADTDVSKTEEDAYRNPQRSMPKDAPTGPAPATK